MPVGTGSLRGQVRGQVRSLRLAEKHTAGRERTVGLWQRWGEQGQPPGRPATPR